jgi:hypothetical protein
MNIRLIIFILFSLPINILAQNILIGKNLGNYIFCKKYSDFWLIEHKNFKLYFISKVPNCQSSDTLASNSQYVIFKSGKNIYFYSKFGKIKIRLKEVRENQKFISERHEFFYYYLSRRLSINNRNIKEDNFIITNYYKEYDNGGDIDFIFQEVFNNGSTARQ